jgi:hypothetical protein
MTARVCRSPARVTGAVTVACPVSRARDIAVVPVYTVSGVEAAPTVAARQDTLRGFAMSVLPIDSLAQNLAREAASRLFSRIGT